MTLRRHCGENTELTWCVAGGVPVGSDAVSNSEGNFIMKKLIIPALLSAAIFAPAAAYADGTPITVEIAYDKALLASDTGAAVVLKSIEGQARDACSARSPVTQQPYVDRTCVKNIKKAAIKKILAEQEVSGVVVAPTLARQNVTLVADAGQR